MVGYNAGGGEGGGGSAYTSVVLKTDYIGAPIPVSIYPPTSIVIPNPSSN